MDVIPVIDLKGGVVVHARMGERERYRPIRTPLAAGSDPVEVVRGLMSIHPFATLYVADLDAITRAGDNRDSLRQMRAAFPRLTYWVDGGIADARHATEWLDEGLGEIVLASEAQADLALTRALAGDPRAILSLDFRGDSLQGPAALLQDAAHWPQRVIVMALSRVGSGAGPDIQRLCTIRDTAPGRQIFAAGGVRDGADLAALKDARIAGALVASSLHDGRLRGPDIVRLQASD